MPEKKVITKNFYEKNVFNECFVGLLQTYRSSSVYILSCPDAISLSAHQPIRTVLCLFCPYCAVQLYNFGNVV